LPSPSDYLRLARECVDKALMLPEDQWEVLVQLADTYMTLAAVAETQDRLKEFDARHTKQQDVA
jgi:hypothetical protein